MTACTSHVAIVALRECDFELVSQPPYLALSDFQLSGYSKESLCGRAVEDEEAVIMAINEWIEEQDLNFFCEVIKALQQDGKSVLISKGIVFKNSETILMEVDFLCVVID